MRKFLLTALALTTPLMLLGNSSAQDRKDWPKTLNFGIIPLEGSSAADERFDSLYKHLEKTLGVKVKSYVGADYAAVILAMKSKKVDLGYFGAKSYIEAADRAGAEALVREDSAKSGIGYKGLIVTQKDSPLNNMEDAKGQDFAFVDPNSTSGYLVPLSYFLLDLKVKPEDYFKRVLFSGTHENVIMGVKNGKIPVGATNDMDVNRAIAKGQVKKDDLKVLWTSDTIPSFPLAARKDLPDSFKKALREALLNFKDPKGLAALNLKGFVPAKDSDYDSIRKLNEAAKANKK